MIQNRGPVNGLVEWLLSVPRRQVRSINCLLKHFFLLGYNTGM